MTKANGATAAAPASRIPQLKGSSTNKIAVAKSASQKKKAAAAAAAPASAGDEVPPAEAPKSAKKKKQSLAPASAPAAAAAAQEDEDEITLFHPATAVVVPAADANGDDAAADPATAAAAAAAAEDAGNDDGGDDDEMTSESFLESLALRQAPELVSVLTDLKTKVKELRRTGVRPLLGQLRAGALPTAEGMSFLELKSHLLLQYLQHLLVFVMCKLAPPPSSPAVAAAAADRQRDVVRRLVYLRSVMEKLRPLDKKLKYQVDKMAKLAAHINLKAVEAAQRGEDAEEAAAQAAAAADAELADGAADPLSFRPNPAALLAATEDAARANAEVGGGASAGGASGGSGLASGATGLYRPPRITATQLDDHEKATSRRNKDLARAQERARGNAYLTSLREELSERPEERDLDLDEYAAARGRGRDQDEADRTDFEERNLLRLTDTRADKARKKAARRASKNTLSDLTGEYDDFRDVERLRGRGDGSGADFLSDERMDELKAQAAPRKRKGGFDADESFDDGLESRHAKKRKGPNGKNSFGSKFAKKGGGGGKGRGGKR